MFSVGPGDVGRGVVGAWRVPGPGGAGVADLGGPRGGAEARHSAVRSRRGELVEIPRDRALAAKVIPPR